MCPFHLSSIKPFAYSFMLGLSVALNLIIGKAMILQGYNPYELSFLRSIIHLAIIVKFYSWICAANYTWYDLLLYVSASCTGVGSWIAIFSSFRYLEVGDGTTLEIGATLVFTVLIGSRFLSEDVDKYDIAILIGDVIGVVLVGKPSMVFGNTVNRSLQGHTLGVIIAIASGSLCAANFTLIKVIVKREVLNKELFLIFHGIVGIPVTVLAGLFSDPWKVSFDFNDCLQIIAYLAVCLGQTTFQALALEADDAKNVIVSVTISCVLAYLGQLTIFKAPVDWVGILGSVCVVTVVVLLQLRQNLRD